MIRIHVICEGQTEEMFVNEVLSEIFRPLDIYLYPSLIGKPGHKGGNFKFERVLRDVKTRLLNDKNAYCTTFFDFYGLPADFPGKKEAIPLADIKAKQEMMTTRLVEQLSKHIDEDVMRRFIPYIQVYEFEALLFSNPNSMASEIGSPELVDDFLKIRNEFKTPEHINNSEITAPSKRIKKVFNPYDKVIYGSLIALEIGVNTIIEECHLFDAWVDKLKAVESLS
ncbi:Gll1842 protein [hydrothermal vent metagenome]|uniref:Gll1842 protein n=1 Tax=hydrothermal vent metagenome TaxID=652676 RepID=A0A3B0XB00_9ZZZZ